MPNLVYEFSAYARYTLYLTAIIALILDLLFADPEKMPHPVVLVGSICAWLDRSLNRPLLSSQQKLARGLMVAIFLPSLLTLALQNILRLLFSLSPIGYMVFRTLLAWQLLAVKGLAKEAGEVAQCLRERGLPAARTQVGRIVGRETAELSSAEVINATVETIAENFADGVIAPLFFLVLFDLPGMFFYKAVNTLDSMIGYRNARYEYFGKSAAKLDDVLNYIPARLAALFLWFGTFFTRLNHKDAWRIFWRDRYKHLSPNSAQTEAVVAGALGIQLGGTHTYHGKSVDKPTIGDAKRGPEISDIDCSIQLLYIGTLIGYVVFLGIRYVAVGF